MLVRNKTVDEQQLLDVRFYPFETKEVPDVKKKDLPEWAEEVKEEKKPAKKEAAKKSKK